MKQAVLWDETHGIKKNVTGKVPGIRKPSKFFIYRPYGPAEWLNLLAEQFIWSRIESEPTYRPTVQSSATLQIEI